MQVAVDRTPREYVPKEYVTCALCGADSGAFWARKHGINIVQCRSCGLVYANPRLDGEQLKEYYSATYFSAGDYAADEQRGRMYELDIRDLISTVGSRGRFLDVGCAYGRFLSYLPDTFQKYGVEYSEQAAAQGRERFGLDIRVGQLHEVPFEDDFFDVVHFRGVLEHLQNPQRDLEVCGRIVKQGGWLVLSTVPNVTGPCGRIYKERFKLVFPREHLYYFSRATLSRFCEQNGFRVERVCYPYLGTPYESVWKDMVAFVTNYVRGLESPPFFRSVITVYARKRAASAVRSQR